MEERNKELRWEEKIYGFPTELEPGVNLLNVLSKKTRGPFLGRWRKQSFPIREGDISLHGTSLIWGEGNGNPLQYSYLENYVDRGAWWAAVHGAAQSRTRLKQLSMHAYIGEGNGNPLQYSCLENPRVRGAWWAAVYRVAQSWTRLKQLSSSSSLVWASQVALVVKNPPANARDIRDAGSIPGSGRSTGRGQGDPLQ